MAKSWSAVSLSITPSTLIVDLMHYSYRINEAPMIQAHFLPRKLQALGYQQLGRDTPPREQATVSNSRLSSKREPPCRRCQRSDSPSHGDKLLILLGTKFFANVLAHFVAYIGAERKWVKGVDEILFVELIRLVAGLCEPEQ
jgi:hypothetical protein